MFQLVQVVERVAANVALAAGRSSVFAAAIGFAHQSLDNLQHAESVVVSALWSEVDEEYSECFDEAHADLYWLD